MIPAKLTLNMTRGDSTTFRVTATDKDNNAVDLATAQIIFTVKHNRNDADSSALIQKKNILAGGAATEIEMIDTDEGIFDIHILPADTSTRFPWKNVEYDIQFIIGGKTTTPVIGDINLIADITRG